MCIRDSMGTVGGGVYRLIQQEGERIARQQGIQLEVKKTLALDYSVEVPDSLKAADVHELSLIHISALREFPPYRKW